MKSYKFVGSQNGFINLASTVTLKVKKSDNTYLIIENIIPNETIIEVDDPLAEKYLDLDPKYEEQ